MTEPSPNLEFSPEESWKHEVASRLDDYRTKNNRKLSGEFSMRFNFEGEPAGPRQQLCVPDAALEEGAVEEAVIEYTPTEEVEAPLLENLAVDPPIGSTTEQIEAPPLLPTLPPMRPSVPFKRKIMMEANVIEFPRLFPAEPPPPWAVAEPVLPTTPRILDAPEIAEPLLETPILDGMRLDPMLSQPAPAFELPLQVASVTRRAAASIADGSIVLLAASMFGAIAAKMLPQVSWNLEMMSAAVAVPVLLWSVYQVLFVLFGARTPGMALTQLAFSTFEGTAPNRSQRLRRLLGIALSCCSLLLGFCWAFFDEDTLCWHDRISRTYAFRQKP